MRTYSDLAGPSDDERLRVGDRHGEREEREDHEGEERAGGELVVCASACRVPRQRESQKFAATSVIESRRAVIVWCVPYRAR